MHITTTESALPQKSGGLRLEIAIALLIKILLLTGLWFLIFRWQDRPAGKPDIARHFDMPGHAQVFSSPQPKESGHVR